MKKILIVEDEPSYVKLLHKELTFNGYAILEATDGKKGLAMALEHHPDLMLLDIRIPLMNGIEVLNELRKDPYGKEAKVILLTNLEPDDKTLQDVIRSKPSFYLIKSDIELADLIQKIKTLLVDDKMN